LILLSRYLSTFRARVLTLARVERRRGQYWGHLNKVTDLAYSLCFLPLLGGACQVFLFD
jgi:hypothetical protein